MNRQMLLAMILVGCGGTEAVCPEGLVPFEGRCVAHDAGQPDGCMSAETCNGEDDDCDGRVDENLETIRYYRDQDGDLIGDDTVACDACGAEYCAGSGPWVTIAGDCDDTCVTCFPENMETCDSLDNDCDALIDEGVMTEFYLDGDGDGFGSGGACSACESAGCGEDWILQDGDCDDACESCLPGGEEQCDDLDHDCDGAPRNGLLHIAYADNDMDGIGAGTPLEYCGDALPAGHAAMNGDCNDESNLVSPTATRFHAEALAGSRLAFDYNCDGREEQEVNSCAASILLRCNSIIDRAAPCYQEPPVTCGELRRHWQCNCVFMGSCRVSTASREQRCR